MGLARRMRHLNEKLLSVRLGPGAARLPSRVQRIHLEFAQKINGGHGGPRHFWRENLPRLKFHNPAVSMSVDRTANQEAPAVLTIYFSRARDDSSPTRRASNATAAPADSTTIDMKHKDAETIWKEFLGITQAEEVVATEEEDRQLRDLAEQRERSEQDRKELKEVVAARRREQEFLDQARSAVA